MRHILGTLSHKFWVAWYLLGICIRLLWRSLVHDLSKFTSRVEREGFKPVTPKLKGTTYGSDEYEKMRTVDLKDALKHHYAVNSHHPEYYENGIDGMDLLDLVEMFCDWRAAIRRHADGSMEGSLEHNRGRFSIPPQLENILRNSAGSMISLSCRVWI